MPIEFTCDCGKMLKVKDDLAGRKVRCPGCQSIVVIPTAQIEVVAEEQVSTVDKKRPKFTLASDEKRKKKRPPDDEVDKENDEVELKKKKKKSKASQQKKTPKSNLPYILAGGALALMIVLGVVAWLIFGGNSGESLKDIARQKNSATNPASLIQITAPKYEIDIAEPVKGVYFSNDGKRLAFNVKNMIQIWSLENAPMKVKEFEGKMYAMSPDGSRIHASITNAPGGRVILDIESGNVISKVDTTEPTRFVSNDELWVMPPQGQGVGSSTKILRLTPIDANTGKRGETITVDSFNGPVYFDYKLPHGKDLIFLSQRGILKIWDTTTKSNKTSITFAINPNNYFITNANDFAMSSDRQWIVRHADDIKVYKCDVTTGQMTLFNTREGPFDLYRGLAFIPNTELFLVDDSGETNRKSFVYNIRTGQRIAVISGFTEASSDKVISQNGFMTFTYNTGKISIWDLSQLK